jgi:hypothetical protein
MLILVMKYKPPPTISEPGFLVSDKESDCSNITVPPNRHPPVAIMGISSDSNSIIHNDKSDDSNDGNNDQIPV